MIETSRREVLAIGALAAMGLLSLPRVSKSEIVADFSAASTRFGLDLLNEIAKQSGVETNLVISPASIMAAFSLVDIGAGCVEAEFEVGECLGGLDAQIAVDELAVAVDRVLSTDHDEAGPGGDHEGLGKGGVLVHSLGF